MATKFRDVRERLSPERRTDMYLSSLRRFVEAMGGELEITASFPEGRVRIQLLEQIGEESEAAKV